MRAFVCAVAILFANTAAADDAPDEIPPRFLAATPRHWRDFRLVFDQSYLRTRADVFNNLDLSRGPTPAGTTLFPLSPSGDHTLTAVDMRLRLQPILEVGQTVRVHLRVDVLDNVGWGTTPDVLPSTSGFASAATAAASPEHGFNAARDAVRIKQAWGEVVLPFGTLMAGRMGSLFSWGTGFFVNNGDCFGCDRGDSGDRVALTVPVASHLLTALYELSATGPYVQWFGQDIPVERRAQVNTAALAFAKWLTPEAQARRLRAGRPLFMYGVFASYRRQELDAPAWTQPGGLLRAYGPNDFLRRDSDSFAADLWLMLHHKGFRAELEAATVIGRIGNASAVAGVDLRGTVTSAQWGGVLSLSYAFYRFPLKLRVELGVASGDSAPGFGTRFAPGQTVARPGDVDGPQLRPPVDMTIDNFRFNPDYRVDLILWRRILGQVSDAVYVKPTVRLGPFGTRNHHVWIDTSLIDSNALYAQSAPGRERHLGVELDLMARYRYEAGFEVGLGYGLFIPGAGFRNLELGRDARPAQTLELILQYRI